jgi:hypothetical protein
MDSLTAFISFYSTLLIMGFPIYKKLYMFSVQDQDLYCPIIVQALNLFLDDLF